MMNPFGQFTLLGRPETVSSVAPDDDIGNPVAEGDYLPFETIGFVAWQGVSDLDKAMVWAGPGDPLLGYKEYTSRLVIPHAPEDGLYQHGDEYVMGGLQPMLAEQIPAGSALTEVQVELFTYYSPPKGPSATLHELGHDIPGLPDFDFADFDVVPTWGDAGQYPLSPRTLTRTFDPATEYVDARAIALRTNTLWISYKNNDVGDTFGRDPNLGAVHLKVTFKWEQPSYVDLSGDLDMSLSGNASIQRLTALKGYLDMSLSSDADIMLDAVLAGEIAMQVEGIGDPSSSASITDTTGHLDMNLTLSGDLEIVKALAGTLPMKLHSRSKLYKQVPLAGTLPMSLVFDEPWLSADRPLQGNMFDPGLDVVLTGDLGGILALVGDVPMNLSMTGAIYGDFALAGDMGLSLGLSGDVERQRGLAGQADMSLSMTGDIGRIVSLAGTLNMTLSPAGHVTDLYPPNALTENTIKVGARNRAVAVPSRDRVTVHEVRARIVTVQPRENRVIIFGQQGTYAMSKRKQPREVVDYDIDMSHYFDDLDDDDFIVSATIEVDNTTVPPLEFGPGGKPETEATGSPAHTLKVWVGGGLHRERYTITALIETNEGRIEEVEFDLVVKEKS